MEKLYSIDCEIVDFQWYTKKIFAIRIYAPNIAKTAKPGQFVMIREKNWNVSPFLSRPMSIARVYPKDNLVELQILITGHGTSLLSELKVSDYLSVIGPLGNSFNIPKNNEMVALVAGGIGIAPLIFLDDEMKKLNKKRLFFYGAMSKEELIPPEFLPDQMRFATDDGSKGFKGFVTEDLEQFLLNGTAKYVYACGPTPMLIAVQKLLKKYNIPGKISIEIEMACGYGICQGCVVEKSESPGEYYLTCMDGPIFGANRISFGK